MRFVATLSSPDMTSMQSCHTCMAAAGAAAGEAGAPPAYPCSLPHLCLLQRLAFSQWVLYTQSDKSAAQVRRLQGQQQAIAGEARALIAKSKAKEAANAKLWEQVRCSSECTEILTYIHAPALPGPRVEEAWGQMLALAGTGGHRVNPKPYIAGPADPIRGSCWRLHESGLSTTLLQLLSVLSVVVSPPGCCLHTPLTFEAFPGSPDV